MKKKSITAAELIKQLSNNPDYQKIIKSKDENIKRNIEAERIIENPIVKDLNSIGFKFIRFHEIEKIKSPNPKAFEIILEHLKKPYPGSTREWLARALGRKDAKFIWEELKSIYKIEKDDKAKEGMAAALSDLADGSNFEEIVEMIKDISNGESRIYFTRNLTRSRNIQATLTLIELQGDHFLGPEIKRILKKKIRK